MKKSILITGASGFIGKNFIQLAGRRYALDTLSMREGLVAAESIDLGSVDTVIYLSGIAHQTSKVLESEYVKVNCDYPEFLSRLAREAGVKHFIYFSSTKVYGDDVRMINAELKPNPQDDYGRSKLMAESLLLSMATKEYRVTIVRCPLVYGPGVKGNIDKIVKLSRTPFLLPLGGIRNSRSMIGTSNLVNFLVEVIDKRLEGIFIPTDGVPTSTSNLVSEIRLALGRKPGLFTLPLPFRRLLKVLKPGIYSRLFESFEVGPYYAIDSILGDRKKTFSEGIKEMISQ